MGTHLQAVLGMYWKHMFIVAKKVIIGNGNTCLGSAKYVLGTHVEANFNYW